MSEEQKEVQKPALSDQELADRLFYGKAVRKVPAGEEIAAKGKETQTEPVKEPEQELKSNDKPDEPANPAEKEAGKQEEETPPAKKVESRRDKRIAELLAKVAEHEAKGEQATAKDHAIAAAAELELESLRGVEYDAANKYSAEHPDFKANFEYYAKMFKEFQVPTFKIIFSEFENKYEVADEFMKLLNSGQLNLQAWAMLPAPAQRARLQQFARMIAKGEQPPPPKKEEKKEVPASIVPEKGTNAPKGFKEMSLQEKADYLFANQHKFKKNHY